MSSSFTQPELLFLKFVTKTHCNLLLRFPVGNDLPLGVLGSLKALIEKIAGLPLFVQLRVGRNVVSFAELKLLEEASSHTVSTHTVVQGVRHYVRDAL